MVKYVSALGREFAHAIAAIDPENPDDRAALQALADKLAPLLGVVGATAPSLISFTRVSVPENEDAGFAVGTPTADGTAPVTITLVNDAGGAFELVSG